jgi:hypothetical protein
LLEVSPVFLCWLRLDKFLSFNWVVEEDLASVLFIELDLFHLGYLSFYGFSFDLSRSWLSVNILYLPFRSLIPIRQLQPFTPFLHNIILRNRQLLTIRNHKSSIQHLSLEFKFANDVIPQKINELVFLIE